MNQITLTSNEIKAVEILKSNLLLLNERAYEFIGGNQEYSYYDGAYQSVFRQFLKETGQFSDLEVNQMRDDALTTGFSSFGHYKGLGVQESINRRIKEEAIPVLMDIAD